MVACMGVKGSSDQGGEVGAMGAVIVAWEAGKTMATSSAARGAAGQEDESEGKWHDDQPEDEDQQSKPPLGPAFPPEDGDVASARQNVGYSGGSRRTHNLQHHPQVLDNESDA
eukprot:CAMPEP_0181185650 /NCGR_PEP_ID=MMETSP1096-20121128/9619_1 /TAXON_ID=156174 ORGANISM="Chrysochromulina ericina, Strain CCMP281" /NCGR_SAMPLE_ID=MMETSP1096 /ASSEMBLY_ACC=CAM_ASM_000453 /LENGTH=112 /DNA_ID=CAMNT_0023274505 /DNA_START=622 /DNA_END=961 /DNA_ORIENTATION=+